MTSVGGNSGAGGGDVGGDGPADDGPGRYTVGLREFV